MTASGCIVTSPRPRRVGRARSRRRRALPGRPPVGGAVLDHRRRARSVGPRARLRRALGRAVGGATATAAASQPTPARPGRRQPRRRDRRRRRNGGGRPLRRRCRAARRDEAGRLEIVAMVATHPIFLPSARLHVAAAADDVASTPATQGLLLDSITNESRLKSRVVTSARSRPVRPRSHQTEASCWLSTPTCWGWSTTPRRWSYAAGLADR